MSRFFKAFVFALIFVVFWVKGIYFLDPDFGWHLASGQLILSEGFSKTDRFSYTMPSFPEVRHDWLSEVIIAKLYGLVGYIGLSFLFSALAFFSFLVVIKKGFFNDYKVLVPLTLAASVILPYIGIRTQVVTLFFFAVLISILFNQAKNLFILVPIFTLWANLHGGFSSGLAVLYLVLVLRMLRERKINTRYVAVLAFSTLATFLNPYGIILWREVRDTVLGSPLRWTISEWAPSIFVFSFPLVLLFSLSSIFIWRARKRIKFEKLVLYILFLLEGIVSRRHVPLWAIVSLPLTIETLGFFRKELPGKSGAIIRFKKAVKISLFASLVLFIFQSTISLKDAILLNENVFYPKNAVLLLKNNLPQGQIFSEYGWGGYLIWKLPEKRVFIDGRMAVWKWKGGISEETDNAFEDYFKILSNDLNFEDISEKYTIDTVLWPTSKRPTLFERAQRELDKFLARFGKETKDFDFLKGLEKEGWRLVYKDNVAVI
ncbi:hypothetical protein HY008_00505, partial [Candidatus Woesebacteria bacterium]|nr:hypothetical protein [Candidatus Woesebacteria bacterium]